MPIIANTSASFASVPNSRPIHVATPACVALRHSPCDSISPATAPTNGPSIKPGNTQENSQHVPERRTDHGKFRCADALRAERGRDEIDRERSERQHAEQRQHDPADALKVVGPRRDDEAAEDQRHARQRRQHGTRESHDHQHGREQPHPEVPFHAAMMHPRAATVIRCTRAPHILLSLSLPPLPIVDVLPELRAALRATSTVVLEAPPGAGKSTVVPLALLDEAWLGGRRILLLQPRRIAARAVARRMAQLAGCEPGELVGYRTRLESRVSGATRIEVVTEGILTRMLQADPALENFGCVIFDEFHERNLQSDLGLALSLDAQANLRDDLRLLVMSATLDGIDVAARRARCASRTFARSHVRRRDALCRHRCRRAPGRRDEFDRPTRRPHRHCARCESDPGDALVFLPGAAEIRRAVAAISEGARDPSLLVLPLFGDLEATEQDRGVARGTARQAQGGRGDQHRRDQPHDRRRAHRDRCRARATPAL